MADDKLNTRYGASPGGPPQIREIIIVFIIIGVLFLLAVAANHH